MGQRSWSQKIWLFGQLTRREVVQRYQGTALGALWPLLMAVASLLLYTFVFSVVLQVRWPVPGTDAARPFEFALILYAGMVPYLVCAEMINRSPGLVLAVPNYVKKVPFPLGILPLVVLASSLLQSAISVVLIAILAAVAWGTLSWAILFLPLVYLPLVLLCLAIGWAASALGVFFRDIAQVAPLAAQLLLFGTPIFYPPDLVPEPFDTVLALNPLTTVVEGFRAVILFGTAPDWGAWAAVSLAFAALAVLAYWLFQRLRPAFADLM